MSDDLDNEVAIAKAKVDYIIGVLTLDAKREIEAMAVEAERAFAWPSGYQKLLGNVYAIWGQADRYGTVSFPLDVSRIMDFQAGGGPVDIDHTRTRATVAPRAVWIAIVEAEKPQVGAQ